MEGKILGTVDNYNIIKEIGAGGCGTVYLGKDKDSGEKCAIKMMTRRIPESEYEKEEEKHIKKIVVTEQYSMKQLSHLNIVKYLGGNNEAVFIDKREREHLVYYIAMELCTKGEVFDFISLTGHLEETHLRYFFHQIMEGLLKIHSSGFSHRDMKLNNLLFDRDYNIKIADFGFASVKKRNTTYAGTENFLSPEIHKKKEYDGKKADIFATGIMLFTMRIQAPPFNSAKPNDPYYKIIGAKRFDKFWKLYFRRRKELGKSLSEEFKDLIENMLAHKPEDRPSVEEIMEHPWYLGEVPTQEEILEEIQRRKDALAASRPENETEPEDVGDPDAFVRRGVDRDIGEGDEEEELKIEEPREVLPYLEGLNRYTEFFSTKPLNDLFNAVASLADISQKVKLSKTDYSASVTFELEKGFKEEEARTVTLLIRILQVDEEKHCVEVLLENGNKTDFFSKYREVKEFFGGLVNASL